MSLEAEIKELTWEAFLNGPIMKKCRGDAATRLKTTLAQFADGSKQTIMRSDRLVKLLTGMYFDLQILKPSIPRASFAEMHAQLTQMLGVQAQSNPGVVQVRELETTMSQMPPSHSLFPDASLGLAQLKQEVLDQGELSRQERNLDLVCGIVSCLESFRKLIMMVFAYHTVPPRIRHQFILDMCRWVFVMLPFPITWRYFQTMIGCCILTTQQMAEIIENMRTSGAKRVLNLFSGRNLAGSLFEMYGVETHACDANHFDGLFHPICVSDASTFLRKELSVPDSGKNIVFSSWSPASYHNAGRDCPDADALRMVLDNKDKVSHVVFIGDGGKSVGTPEAYALLRGPGFNNLSVSKAFVFGIPHLLSYPTPDDFVSTVKVRQD